jgi:tetratricopeptide (TPR) repeat protein
LPRLKSQPNERYATADAFAQDVERHLKGERVLAQPESIRYRLARGLRRHRAAFAAGTAIVIAVFGAAGVSLVQAKRASDAAERARVVKEFVVDVFKVNERGTARSMELRQLPAELLLDRGAKLIQTRFPGRPELQAELYGVVGGIFADMGANGQAAEYATKQVEALVAIDAKATDQAKGMILLTQALLAEGRVSDARVRADRALALSDSSDELRPEALVLLARVMYTQGDKEGTRRTLDRADRDLINLHRPTTAAAASKSLRASLLLTDNRFDEALPQYLSAIETALSAEGASSPTAIRIRLSLAWSLVILDRPEEAKGHLEAALSALRDSGGPGEIGAALSESRFFAHMYAGMSPSQIPFAEARAVVERDREVLERHGHLVPAKIKASIERELSMILVRWGDLAAATPLSDHSHAILETETESPGGRWHLANSQGSLAALLGRHDKATAFFRDVVDLRRKTGEENHPWASYDHAKVAMNFRMQGKFDEAERAIAAAPHFELLRGAGDASQGYEYILPMELAAVKLARGEPGEALKLMPPESTDLKASIFFPYDQMQLRGEILCALGRHEEGLEKLRSAVELHQALVAPQDPRLARARSVEGLCALRGGQEALARELEILSREAFEAQPDVSPYFKVTLKGLQDRLRERRPTKLASRK